MAHHKDSFKFSTKLNRCLRHFFKACLIVWLYLSSTEVSSQTNNSERSVWDLGIGLTHFNIPDYNGSDNITTITTPFPYIVYTGKLFRVKDGSVQSVLFSSERLYLGLSGDGTPPVSSDKNTVRSQMPNLDPVLELGPSLEYYLSISNNRQSLLFLELPLRTAIATDLKSTQHIGWVTNPRIKYHFQHGKWRFRLGAGPGFANNNYYQYYYGVSPEFETQTRPAYEAKSGFGGMHYTSGFGWRHKNIYLGGYVRYIDLSNAVFEPSPLVERNHSLLSGVSIAWIFNSRQ